MGGMSDSEREAAVEALRQKINALPPTDFCGHFSSDFNGNCMQCAREAERRADMARAWDEGHDSCGQRHSCPNPYRDEAVQ